MNQEITLQPVFKDNIFDNSISPYPRPQPYRQTLESLDCSLAYQKSNLSPNHYNQPLLFNFKPQQVEIEQLPPFNIDEQSKLEHQPHNGMCKSILSIANSSDIFGALLLPYLFKVAAFPLVIVSFLLSYTISIFSSFQLLKLYQQKRQVNIIKLAILTNMTYNMINLIKLIIFLNHFFHSVLVIVVAGDCLAGILKTQSTHYNIQDTHKNGLPLWLTQRFQTMIAGILIAPFCLKPKFPTLLCALSRALAFLALMIIVLGAFIQQIDNNPQQISPSFAFSLRSTVIALPCLLMIFAYHQQFILSNHSRKPDHVPFDDTLITQSLLGSLSILICYFLIGTMTFLTYDQQITNQSQNILILTILDTSISNILVLISFSLFVAAALTQCIQYNSLALKVLIQAIDPLKKLNQQLFISSTAIALHLLILISAVAICDIDIMITVIGAITQNFVSIILPCIMFVRVFKGIDQGISYYCTILTLILAIIYGFSVFLCLIWSLYPSYQAQ